MRKLLPLAAVAVFALTFSACTDTEVQGTGEKETTEDSAVEPEHFDPLSIEAVPDIQAMVPADIAASGKLVSGTSANQAPGEFRHKGSLTGYNIEIVQALGQVMGLQGTVREAEFQSIIPGLGREFDIGVSSLTISPERLEKANMISYLEVGSAFAVARGNPADFSPEDPCGSTLGVQAGTYQEDIVELWSKKCVEDKKKPIELLSLDTQREVNAQITDGSCDATLADSPVITYAVLNSSGRLQQIGDVIQSEPQGIAVALADEQLTVAIQAAMQYLMDEHYLEAILTSYDAEDVALTQAEINPGKR